MMRATWVLRAAVTAGALVVSSAQSVRAADCATQDQAIHQFQQLMQAATQRMQAESEPDQLRKDKVGLVLVARPAAERKTDEDALRRDIDALSERLDRAPREICGAIESIRRTHGL